LKLLINCNEPEGLTVKSEKEKVIIKKNPENRLTVVLISIQTSYTVTYLVEQTPAIGYAEFINVTNRFGIVSIADSVVK
jgi:hypothetical protein